MEFIFELLFELLASGTVEASKNKKVPKPIRNFLIAFIVAFFVGVIGLIIFTGILCIKENILISIFFIIIGIILAISSIMSFKKVYLNKKNVRN